MPPVIELFGYRGSRCVLNEEFSMHAAQPGATENCGGSTSCPRILEHRVE